MKNVHGNNDRTEITFSLPLWSAFHLAFWPSLAFVIVGLLG